MKNNRLQIEKIKIIMDDSNNDHLINIIDKLIEIKFKCQIIEFRLVDRFTKTYRKRWIDNLQKYCDFNKIVLIMIN